MNPIIIAVANQKGGVGKTTTAVNLAAGLVIRGYSTLLVDFDSQCNSTNSFLAREIVSVTLADVLVGHGERPPIDSAIYQTHLEGLDLAASHIRLAMVERQVQIEEQYRLKDALNMPDYQFIIIDCPPSLGMTLTQALLAATHVLVPVAAQYYPLEGVVDLTETIRQTRRANPQMQVLGFLVTMFDQRNTVCSEALQKLKELFGESVFQSIIRTNVKLQTAPAHRQSIFEHARSSYGAIDYDNLIDEMLDRLQVRSPLHIVKPEAQHG